MGGDGRLKRYDRVRSERLLREVGRHQLDGSQQVRYLWMREALLGEGWSGGTRQARLLDVVRQIIDQGDDQLALDALSMFSLRSWWQPPPPEQRAEIVALAERLDADPRTCRGAAREHRRRRRVRGRDRAAAALRRPSPVPVRDRPRPWGRAARGRQTA